MRTSQCPSTGGGLALSAVEVGDLMLLYVQSMHALGRKLKVARQVTATAIVFFHIAKAVH